MTAVLRMCEPVTTPCPPTPAIRMLKRFAIAPPSHVFRRCDAADEPALRPGHCGSRLREKLLIAVPISEVLLGLVGVVFRELIPIVLDGLRVFHHLVRGDRVLD